MSTEKPKNIVLIHGLWMTSLSWENWTKRYTDQGYNVIARSWPGIPELGDDLEAFRKDPSAVSNVGVTEVVDHYEKIINELDSPPIIMGHSFGGLMTQILLDRGLGVAGVAVDAAPVKGILILPFSTIKVAWPALSNPLNNHRAGGLTAEQFRYAFGNNLSEEESNAVFQKYAVPGPDHLLFQASFANFNPHAATSVNFHNNDRAPLLLIAGGNDHIVPAVVTEANYKLYRKSTAVTELKEYPGRSHFTVGEKGWEEVADYALDWAVSHARSLAGAAG